MAVLTASSLSKGAFPSPSPPLLLSFPFFFKRLKMTIPSLSTINCDVFTVIYSYLQESKRDRHVLRLVSPLFANWSRPYIYKTRSFALIRSASRRGDLHYVRSIWNFFSDDPAIQLRMFISRSFELLHHSNSWPVTRFLYYDAIDQLEISEM